MVLERDPDQQLDAALRASRECLQLLHEGHLEAWAQREAERRQLVDALPDPLPPACRAQAEELHGLLGALGREITALMRRGLSLPDPYAAPPEGSGYSRLA